MAEQKVSLTMAVSHVSHPSATHGDVVQATISYVHISVVHTAAYAHSNQAGDYICLYHAPEGAVNSPAKWEPVPFVVSPKSPTLSKYAQHVKFIVGQEHVACDHPFLWSADSLMAGKSQLVAILTAQPPLHTEAIKLESCKCVVHIAAPPKVRSSASNGNTSHLVRVVNQLGAPRRCVVLCSHKDLPPGTVIDVKCPQLAGTGCRVAKDGTICAAAKTCGTAIHATTLNLPPNFDGNLIVNVSYPHGATVPPTAGVTVSLREPLRRDSAPYNDLYLRPGPQANGTIPDTEGDGWTSPDILPEGLYPLPDAKTLNSWDAPQFSTIIRGNGAMNNIYVRVRNFGAQKTEGQVRAFIDEMCLGFDPKSWTPIPWKTDSQGNPVYEQTVDVDPQQVVSVSQPFQYLAPKMQGHWCMFATVSTSLHPVDFEKMKTQPLPDIRSTGNMAQRNITYVNVGTAVDTYLKVTNDFSTDKTVFVFFQGTNCKGTTVTFSDSDLSWLNIAPFVVDTNDEVQRGVKGVVPAGYVGKVHVHATSPEQPGGSCFFDTMDDMTSLHTTALHDEEPISAWEDMGSYEFCFVPADAPSDNN